jgi:hypothetical protein
MIKNLPECRVLCFAEGGAALERLLPQLNIAAGQTALLVPFQQQGRLEGQLHAGEEIIVFLYFFNFSANKFISSHFCDTIFRLILPRFSIFLTALPLYVQERKLLVLRHDANVFHVF